MTTGGTSPVAAALRSVYRTARWIVIAAGGAVIAVGYTAICAVSGLALGFGGGAFLAQLVTPDSPDRFETIGAAVGAIGGLVWAAIRGGFIVVEWVSEMPAVEAALERRRERRAAEQAAADAAAAAAEAAAEEAARIAAIDKLDVWEPGPVTGWRSFAVAFATAEGRRPQALLVAPHNHEPFEARTSTARCLLNGSRHELGRDVVPDPNCCCGFNALDDPSYVDPVSKNAIPATARVSLAGRVLRHTHLLRGERATLIDPITVHLHCSVRAGSCDSPTVAVLDDGIAYPYCAEHAGDYGDAVVIDQLATRLRSDLEARYGIGVTILPQDRSEAVGAGGSTTNAVGARP